MTGTTDHCCWLVESIICRQDGDSLSMTMVRLTECERPKTITKSNVALQTITDQQKLEHADNHNNTAASCLPVEASL